MSSRKLAHFSPARTVLFSIFLTIIIGTLLLALPIARIRAIGLIDLFFTATSATCVTGLFTIPLSDFTFFGQCIILALIQIGGLGMITMTLFLISLFVDIGLATQLMGGQLLEIESWKNLKKIIFFIILITLSIEVIGALCMLPVFTPYYPLSYAFFLSLFHAISAFCSAGIALFKNNFEHFSTNYIMLAITGLLMFAGGLGFVTWYEIIQYVHSRKKKRRYSFSLHSKIILYGSAITIALSMLLIFLLEYASLPFSSWPHGLINSLYLAISFRSSGFLTISPSQLQSATIFLIMLIGFIGSAPGSTGSGVKITTFAVFLATIKGAIQGRTSVEIKGRRIPKDQVFKVIAIVFLSLFWVGITTFCLLITEHNW